MTATALTEARSSPPHRSCAIASSRTWTCRSTSLTRCRPISALQLGYAGSTSLTISYASFPQRSVSWRCCRLSLPRTTFSAVFLKSCAGALTSHRWTLRRISLQRYPRGSSAFLSSFSFAFLIISSVKCRKESETSPGFRYNSPHCPSAPGLATQRVSLSKSCTSCFHVVGLFCSIIIHSLLDSAGISPAGIADRRPSTSPTIGCGVFVVSLGS